MAYPGFIAQDFLGPDLGSSQMGQYGFTVGSIAYAFVTHPASTVTHTFKIGVFKSTDVGQTWIEIATASSPQIPLIVGSGTPVWTVAKDGSNAIALWAEMQNNGVGNPYTVAHIGKAVFSFSSGTWGAQTQIANPGLDMVQYTALIDAGDQGNSLTLLQLIVRGAGNYILYYQGTCNVLSGTPTLQRQSRVSYSTFNGTIFGPQVQLPGQDATHYYLICGGCVDTSGLTTLLFTRKGWPGLAAGGVTAVSCSLTAADALGSPVDVVVLYQDTWAGRMTVSAPVAYSAGGVAHVAFATMTSEGGAPDFPTAIRVFDTLSLPSPTWTNHLLTNDQAVQPALPAHFFAYPYMFAAMSDNTNLAIVWTQNNSNIVSPPVTTSFYYSIAPVGTLAWATPALLWSPPLLDGPNPGQANQVNMYLTISGFGVLGVTTSVEGDTSVEVQSGFIPSSGIGLGIDCNDPPDGALGDPYSHPLTISGAPAGSTVSITGGALPPGLTINSAGVISGTPTLAGSYGLVATVTPPALLRSPRSFTPVTVGTSIQGYDISDNVCGGYAFAYSGAQYAFLRGGGLGTPPGDQKIHAFKSADSGATWVELDAGAAIPHAAVGGFGSAYAVGTDGSTAYVITARATNLDTGPVDDSFDGIGVTTFDLTAGLWGATVNHSTPQVTVWHENPPGGPRRPSLQLVVLGPGSYLLFYGGPFEVLSGGSYGRVYCATFNGSTFGAGVMLPGQAGDLHSYTAVGAVAGSDGTAQLLFQKDDGLNTLYSVGRQSGGTFGTPQTVASKGYFHNTVDFSPPCLYQTGAVESIGVLGWINGPTHAELHVFHAPMALNPVWQDSFTCTVDDDTTGGPPTSATYAVVVAQFANVGTPFSLSASADTIWALWTTTAPLGAGTASRIWYCQADTATLTWTAPAMLVESAYQGTAPFLKPVASQVVSWDMEGDGLGAIVLTQDYNSLAEAAESIVVGGGGGGGTASVACVVTVGYGDLSTSCGAPPAYTVGVAGARYRPPIVMGTIGLPPVYDQNDTLVWTFPVAVPPGFHWETNPASSDYGYLVGTPTASGVQSFTYTVSTPDGQSITNTCPFDVAPADDGGGGGGGEGEGINITCANPPGGKVGVPYSHTFPVTGATGPTRYSVVVGALPPGVYLDPATGDLSGTPTAPGTYSFSVKVQQ